MIPRSRSKEGYRGSQRYGEQSYGEGSRSDDRYTDRRKPETGWEHTEEEEDELGGSHRNRSKEGYRGSQRYKEGSRSADRSEEVRKSHAKGSDTQAPSSWALPPDLAENEKTTFRFMAAQTETMQKNTSYNEQTLQAAQTKDMRKQIDWVDSVIRNLQRLRSARGTERHEAR